MLQKILSMVPAAGVPLEEDGLGTGMSAAIMRD